MVLIAHLGKMEVNVMAMITVDGVEMPCPSSLTWGLQDVSDSDAGRTLDTIMHKNRVGQKRKLSLEWIAKTPEETSRILQAFNPEYVSVKYPDAMSGQDETRTFYVGDRSAPVWRWFSRKKIYESISFDIIEV